MPAQRGTKKLVYVQLGAIKYGWMTGTVEEALGQVEVTGTYPNDLVIGANSPKPGRATKNTATGTKSGFCAPASVAAARAANWKVSRSKRRVAASTTLSKPVYVEIGNVKYGWSMPAATYAQLNLTELGIKDATASDTVIFGASYPKPPRVALVVGAGTAGETSYSSFCEPNKLDSLPDGYKLVSSGNYPEIPA